MTTATEIKGWFDRGINSKMDFMIVVCDTYDYEDYPVFCKSEQFAAEYAEHNGPNMQKIMEVYNLSIPWEKQQGHRVFNPPVGFDASKSTRSKKYQLNPSEWH